MIINLFGFSFFANSSESSKVFIVAWFTIIISIAFVLFKDNRGAGFLDMNFCKWITRQHLRCHHGNIFQNFDELFAGKSYIRIKQKNNVDDMSQLPFLFYTGRFKKSLINLFQCFWMQHGNPKISMVKINGFYAQ